MNLLRLDASILPATSASRALGDLVEEQWLAAHPESAVARHDLSTDPISASTWQDAVTAGFVPEEHRTDSQRDAVALATRIADELIDSDALLFTVPLYNFGVSQHFKTWFDVAYTDPRIDAQGTALRGSPPRSSPASAATTTPAPPSTAGTTPPLGCAGSSRTCGAWTCEWWSAPSPSSGSTPRSTLSRISPRN